MSTLLLLLCAVGVLPAAFGHAETYVPPYINYQGTLTDQDGKPLATGSYTLKFSVYDSTDAAASPVWGPQVFDGATGQGHGAKVHVVGGAFNVILGPEDKEGRPLAGAFASGTAYLGITVDDGSEIAPRQAVLSAPYAIMAESADHVVGQVPFVKGPIQPSGTYKFQNVYTYVPGIDTTLVIERVRPVMITFAQGLIQFENNGSTGPRAFMQLEATYEDGSTEIVMDTGSFILVSNAFSGLTLPLGGLSTVHMPTKTGPVTYRLKGAGWATNQNENGGVANAQLVVVQL